MNCNTANQMMNLFFENELSFREEAEFIKHLESCKDCYKEAETYFMLKAAQTLLSVDSEENDFDLEAAFERFLMTRKKRLSGHKTRNAIIVTSVLLILAAGLYFALFR